ncbi:ABC transporter permease [Agathobaculum sp.]|uniref:ABC transporter permease n=1 Tax=Agathobaculum sp. TaxID=2048138 RepID=UPI002A8190F8|nr:ABC transporter permease [Agathobaculum sp.]MDY3619458.1 ABC transporter permease [Agathobaculum sp.]
MTETKKPNSRMKEILSKLGPLLALALICIALAIATQGKFVTTANILNLLRQVPIVALMSVGMLCVILLGGIDLSAGSLLAISTGVTAVLMKRFFTADTAVNSILLVVICLVVGTVAGMINGLLLTKLHLPHPFIATLGTKNIYRGITLVIMGSAAIAGFPKGALLVGTAEPFGIPLSFILTVVVFVLMHIFLSNTPLGRKIYSFGGNSEAARLAGINTDRVQVTCYALSGFFCALAGIVYIGRLNSAVPLASQEGDLDAIASCIIGGASFLGGKGNVWGTLIGAFMITVIRNGCNLLGVSSDLQLIVIGAIIIIAVFVDVVRSRMEAKKKRLEVAKASE